MIAQAVAWKAPLVLTFSAGPNAALLTAPNVGLWVADSNCEIVFASEIHETLGTDGSAVAVDVVKVADGAALSTGTSLLASTFNLKSTVNTLQKRSLSPGTLAADRTILTGQRIGLKFSGTMTSVTGVNIVVVLNRLNRPVW
ncbi:MAG: hypothetical protein EBS84_22645 [Proteobacteria bacterium]|nr:hypothetical protein [Pseudomonadota bacterium]